MCCDCCLLGKAAQELNQPCDQNLSLGQRCGEVSQACCLDGASANQTTPTQQTERGWEKSIMYLNLYFAGN